MRFYQERKAGLRLFDTVGSVYIQSPLYPHPDIAETSSFHSQTLRWLSVAWTVWPSIERSEGRWEWNLIKSCYSSSAGEMWARAQWWVSSQHSNSDYRKTQRDKLHVMKISWRDIPPLSISLWRVENLRSYRYKNISIPGCSFVWSDEGEPHQLEGDCPASSLC